MGSHDGPVSSQETHEENSMKCVTTFSPEGYNEYGERFLHSYVKHVKIPLVAYVEDTPPFKHQLIEYRDIYGIPDLSSFLNHAKSYKTPNYLYDAGKFSHKAYAQIDCLEKNPKEEIFWLDADVVFFDDVSEWELKGYLKNVCLAFLGRNTYSECGFIGFDTGHKHFPMFLSHYRDMYYKRRIFELQHWTDCHAFDHARRGIASNDLTGGTGMQHVWCESPLAKFSDHIKGKRKQIGASPEHPNFEQIQATYRDSRRKTA